MKIFFSVCLLAMLGLTGFSQNNSPNIDPRLFDVYSSDQIAEMQADQPQTLAYLNYYVQNSYEIIHGLPDGKTNQFEDISVIKNSKTGESLLAIDIEQINILNIDIVRKSDEYLTYKVGNDGTVIVFIAPKIIVEQFNSLK